MRISIFARHELNKCQSKGSKSRRWRLFCRREFSRFWKFYFTMTRSVYFWKYGCLNRRRNWWSKNWYRDCWTMKCENRDPGIITRIIWNILIVTYQAPLGAWKWLTLFWNEIFEKPSVKNSFNCSFTDQSFNVKTSFKLFQCISRYTGA